MSQNETTPDGAEPRDVRALLNRTEVAKIADLKPHPKNYRKHPADQLAHIKASILRTGFYRNVVVAEDGVILAGHGVIEAATQLGLQEVPVIRLPIPSDSPAALKVLTGDNETGKLAEIDDRALTEILRSIRDEDPDGLLGTGLTDEMLANLLFVSRPASEIRDKEEAAHYVGMPEFGESGEQELKIVVSFRTEAARKEFAEKFDLKCHYKSQAIWSVWWPLEERDDLISVKFESVASPAPAAETGTHTPAPPAEEPAQAAVAAAEPARARAKKQPTRKAS